MKEQENEGKQYAVKGNQEKPVSSFRNENKGQRYNFTITDTAQTDSPVTVLVEVMDDAIARLTATDNRGTDYEVAFYLKRLKKKFNPEAANIDDDDKDECQVCTVQGGVLVCKTVPCDP